MARYQVNSAESTVKFQPNPRQGGMEMKKLVLRYRFSEGVFEVKELPRKPSTLELPKESCVREIKGTPKDLEEKTVKVRWMRMFTNVPGETDILPVYEVI